MIDTDAIEFLIDILSNVDKKDFDPNALPSYCDEAKFELSILKTRLAKLVYWF